MLFALAFLATMADWVPIRWTSADPKSLELLQGTPVNCVLLEKAYWSEPLVTAAANQGVVTLALLHPEGDAMAQAQKAIAQRMQGVVLEGDFADDVSARIRAVLADSKLSIVELPPRSKMRFDGSSAIAGTYQGVWPGIQAEEEGKAHAAPSGAPWINTNSGFLRFVRAVTDATVWMGYVPPPKTVITTERYLQAISDAAMVGARWILAFDEDYAKRFYGRDEKALKEWKRMTDQLGYFESHKEWRSLRPLSDLAIVQDVDTGALFSGGVLDMIAVKHTPVRPIPSRKLGGHVMDGAKMAVNVDPGALTDDQKAALRAFARSGGTLLSGASGWKFPSTTPERITLGEEEVKKLDEIWKELNTMTGRRNLGARLFNVSSMLSNLLESPAGKGAVLQLVNYSDYPVENVTVHLLSKFKTARLLAPGAEPKKLEVYEVEEGSGVDIDNIGVTATLVLE